MFTRPARIFIATNWTLRGFCRGSVALAVAGVLFCRLNKFTLVYFSLLAKPWMVLLAYSSAYSASPSFFLVMFRELILCQSSAYLGSSYGARIGKRLVGNMTPESEVRFCPNFTSSPFVYLEGLYAFLRPFTSKTTSILHTYPCGISIPVPSPRPVWSYRMILSEAVLLEYCCKEGVYYPYQLALFHPL